MANEIIAFFIRRVNDKEITDTNRAKLRKYRYNVADGSLRKKKKYIAV